MWKQIAVNFPNWDKKEDVNYWLGYTAFSLEKYWEGFKHIESLPEGLKLGLIANEFSSYTVEDLKKVNALNPKNKHIGTLLIRKMMSQPYIERDHFLLEELSTKFGVEVMDVEEDISIIKKDTYAIAAVLPFMFEGIGTPQTVIRNAIIFDFYKGMQLAQSDLQRNGISLEIFPFDTKKSRAKTKELIQSGAIESADVIVGPLYRGPREEIYQYSKEKKISMLNPLSSSSEIIGNNPYSFLFKPSYETQGKKAADFAKKTFTENKLVYILYETDRDSLLASVYKEELERDSFFVMKYERMTNESAQQIQKDFTEKYDFRLDTLYSAAQIDSISLIPGRYVKERPLRDEETGEIIKDEEENDVMETYEERYFVEPDSIGHMLVASGSNLLANNFISLTEVRSDSIGIIGYQNWLDFSTVSYDQLERLGINFISPDLFRKDLPWFGEFEKDFIDVFGEKPSEYHLLGYEVIYHLGRLLSENGKYFQIGLRAGKYYTGKVMNGIQYGTYNDNQVVPITKLEDLSLVNQVDKED